MWLMNYITRNSITAPSAVRGSVTNSSEGELSVVSSGEHSEVRLCMPYGIASMPPSGEKAVVLPLDGTEVSLGVMADTSGLEDGEIRLCSRGGASIVLKNDGRVLINGREF